MGDRVTYRLGKDIVIHPHIHYPGQWLWTCAKINVHGRTIPIDIQTEEGVRDYVREDLLGRIYEIQQIIDDVSEVRHGGA